LDESGFRGPCFKQPCKEKSFTEETLDASKEKGKEEKEALTVSETILARSKQVSRPLQRSTSGEAFFFS